MHFVFHQVSELQHIGIADGDGLIERLTCAPIEELHFAAIGQASAAQ